MRLTFYLIRKSFGSSLTAGPRSGSQRKRQVSLRVARFYHGNRFGIANWAPPVRRFKKGMRYKNRRRKKMPGKWLIPGEEAALQFLLKRNENVVDLGWGGAPVVYTDGACCKNGKDGAHAGIGVWYGENDPRNVSAALKGEVQTNQRAELAAFLYVLEAFAEDVAEKPEGQRLMIKSDSRYCVNGWKSWLDGWIARGWRTSADNDVSNEDLWRQASLARDRIADSGAEVVAVWVKGHAESYGNHKADELAVAGRMKHPFRAEYEKELEAKRLARNARAREKARRQRAGEKKAKKDAAKEDAAK